jgi:hypothetical protein
VSVLYVNASRVDDSPIDIEKHFPDKCSSNVPVVWSKLSHVNDRAVADVLAHDAFYGGRA